MICHFFDIPETRKKHVDVDKELQNEYEQHLWEG